MAIGYHTFYPVTNRMVQTIQLVTIWIPNKEKFTIQMFAIQIPTVFVFVLCQTLPIWSPVGQFRAKINESSVNLVTYIWSKYIFSIIIINTYIKMTHGSTLWNFFEFFNPWHFLLDFSHWFFLCWWQCGWNSISKWYNNLQNKMQCF